MSNSDESSREATVQIRAREESIPVSERSTFEWPKTAESHVTVLLLPTWRATREESNKTKIGVCTRRGKPSREEETAAGKGDEKAGPRSVREPASVAINSMLTRIISEGSNEAAGQRRNRDPSLSRALSRSLFLSYLHLPT